MLCTVAVLGREGCHRGDAVVAVLSRVPPREGTLGNREHSQQRTTPKQPQILLLTWLCHASSRQVTPWCEFMLVKRDQSPEVVPNSLFQTNFMDEFLAAVKSWFPGEEGLSLLPLRVFSQPSRSSV